MIADDKIILLAQLVDSLEQSFKILVQAYEKQDKKRFDQAKAGISDFQSKISFLLKQS